MSRSTIPKKMLHPSQLACRWYGHLIKELMIRTKKNRSSDGDPEFIITQECKRCGYVKEMKVMGSQPCYIDNDRLQESFEIWRTVKIRELQASR